jgi:hypothetical protein
MLTLHRAGRTADALNHYRHAIASKPSLFPERSATPTCPPTPSTNWATLISPPGSASEPAWCGGKRQPCGRRPSGTGSGQNLPGVNPRVLVGSAGSGPTTWPT